MVMIIQSVSLHQMFDIWENTECECQASVTQTQIPPPVVVLHSVGSGHNQPVGLTVYPQVHSGGLLQ